MAGTNAEARRTARAQLEVNVIALALAEFDDGIFGTRGEAVVALEAVAARQAALSFAQRLALVETADDFLETVGAHVD